MKRCLGNFNSIGINVKYHQSSLVNLKLEVFSLWTCLFMITSLVHNPSHRLYSPKQKMGGMRLSLTLYDSWVKKLPWKCSWSSVINGASNSILKNEEPERKKCLGLWTLRWEIHILIDKAESVFKARIINRKLKKTRGHSDTPNIRKHIKWNF